MRCPFQVLIIPYTKQAGSILFAVFKRADLGFWQWLSGGGEDLESPLDAAKREAHEEFGIDPNNRYIALDSITSINAGKFKQYRHLWPADLLVIPEYSFAVEVTMDSNLKISKEHSEYLWLTYEEAGRKLKWDSNKTALRELNERLEMGLLIPAKAYER